jgi:hypothetical protein
MPIKSLALHFVLNSALMRLKLAPITPQSGVSFISGRPPLADEKKRGNSHVTVVLMPKSIEVHEFSPDPREGHSVKQFLSSKEFIASFVGTRIEWAARVHAFQSPEVAALRAHSKESQESFLKWANANYDFEQATISNLKRELDRYLNGFLIKFSRLILGY